jgi:cellulose synthase/poly-beta-1,6-N-acetylglucosamine synthase-like glycosyltransferase
VAILGATIARATGSLGQLGAGLAAGANAAGIPLGAVVAGCALGGLAYYLLLRLRSGPRYDYGGTVNIRIVGSPQTEPWSEEEPASPADGVPRVPVYHSTGVSYRLPMEGAGAHPSLPLPRALRFVLTLLIAFLLLACFFLAFFDDIFGGYDHLVGLVGTFLYWPIPWPGIYVVGPNVLAVGDYLFPMYLSGLLAFAIALGLVTNRPRRSRTRRLLALAVIVGYIAAEFLLDALLFTTPGANFRHAGILIRALTGGFFLALMALLGVHLPRPQRIRPKFEREPGAVGYFIGVGAAAFLIALAGLTLVPYALRQGGLSIVVTVLLLLPTVTLMVFGLIGGPLYRRRLRRRPLPPLAEYHPSVSVLIPAYNEAEWIVQAIESADTAAGLYPGRVEIIVGNDGSKDATSPLARAAVQKLKHCTGCVVDLPHGGKSNALNGALAVAQGEIVLRLDGDTYIDPTTGFGPMIRHFADPQVGGVQGAIHPRQREGWTRKMRALEIAWNHYLLRPATMETRSAEVIDGLFSAFRREDLVKLGGWVPWNGEDTEISIRIQRLGYRIRIEFGALAYEDVPGNYDSLRRQRVRWARGVLMANGQHFPALIGPAPEFGGLGVFLWFLMFVRSGLRSLVYLFLLALILILGVPALLFAGILFLVAMLLRAGPLAYYLVKMHRTDAIPWIPFFPFGNVIKQSFRLEAFGTLGPNATGEYV